MKVIKLSENLYEIRLPFWYWAPRRYLIKGLQEIQSHGKVVNVVISSVSGFVLTYIVLTS